MKEGSAHVRGLEPRDRDHIAPWRRKREIPGGVARRRLALGLHDDLVVDAELAVWHPAQPALDHHFARDMRTQHLTCSRTRGRVGDNAAQQQINNV